MEATTEQRSLSKINSDARFSYEHHGPGCGASRDAIKFLEENNDLEGNPFKIRSGHAILEIGFGHGEVLIEAASQRGCTVVQGFDVAQASIDEVERQWKKRGVNFGEGTQIQARYLDCSDEPLPLEDNTFDFAFFMESIEHMSNPLRAVSEIKRVLKPDGILVLSHPWPEDNMGYEGGQHAYVYPGLFEQGRFERFMMQLYFKHVVRKYNGSTVYNIFQNYKGEGMMDVFHVVSGNGTEDQFYGMLRPHRAPNSPLVLDTQVGDWSAVLNGVPWQMYTQQPREMYEQLKATNPNADRDDLLRDHFNNMAGQHGNRNPDGIDAFYYDEHGIHQRVVVWEMGETGVLGNMAAGRFLEQQAQGQAFEEASKRFRHRLRALDHGTGPGNCLVPLALAQVRAVGYEWDTPAIRLLKRAFAAYVPGSKVTFVTPREGFESQGPYNLVYSSEVMEHLLDPVGEIQRIARCMEPGGYLYLSTFFNDCHGKNPQHLTENNVFQDVDLWMSEVRRAGFDLAGHDENGVAKVFVRRQHI